MRHTLAVPPPKDEHFREMGHSYWLWQRDAQLTRDLEVQGVNR